MAAGVIYKYPLDVIGIVRPLSLPDGAEILSVGLDPDDAPVLWALVQPDRESFIRRIIVVPTGFDLPDGITGVDLIGRIDVPNGAGFLRFHVFEVVA